MQRIFKGLPAYSLTKSGLFCAGAFFASDTLQGTLKNCAEIKTIVLLRVANKMKPKES